MAIFLQDKTIMPISNRNRSLYTILILLEHPDFFLLIIIFIFIYILLIGPYNSDLCRPGAWSGQIWINEMPLAQTAALTGTTYPSPNLFFYNLSLCILGA